ncbi:hypothetical protein TNCV_3971731 [Trichonephila clavipes]|nr:hypothetical protein TNCV_3971731 [Trichonephila clavipes]
MTFDTVDRVRTVKLLGSKDMNGKSREWQQPNQTKKLKPIVCAAKTVSGFGATGQITPNAWISSSEKLNSGQFCNKHEEVSINLNSSVLVRKANKLGEYQISYVPRVREDRG